MKTFFGSLKSSLAGYLMRCSGPDQLGLALFVAALVLQLMDAFLGTGILYLLSIAAYGYALFRFFSRNKLKRAQENSRFMQEYGKLRLLVMRYWTRLKNCREYKYFSCPQCKASIRMKRGMGEKEITCPGCKHVFKQKS